MGWWAEGKDEIQGSLHCGGKSAAFGRDDVILGAIETTFWAGG
jgi:hypothetical protein